MPGLTPEDVGDHAVVARLRGLHQALVTVDQHVTQDHTGV